MWSAKQHGKEKTKNFCETIQHSSSGNLLQCISNTYIAKWALSWYHCTRQLCFCMIVMNFLNFILWNLVDLKLREPTKPIEWSKISNNYKVQNTRKIFSNLKKISNYRGTNSRFYWNELIFVFFYYYFSCRPPVGRFCSTHLLK